MQELEKILEEIQELRGKAGSECTSEDHYIKKAWELCLDQVTEIIRKNMNDGWISVDERLPEEKINPISRDFYEYQVTAKFGNAKDVRYYRYGNGHWWNGPGVVDKYVIAWRENPEPYRQEQPEICKYTGGSCCWPIEQCRECPNHPERSEE